MGNRSCALPLALYFFDVACGGSPRQTGVNLPPVAQISGSDHGVVGDMLTFDASGSKRGGAPLATYRFTFGDGTPATSQTSSVIAHAYQRVPG